MVELKTKASYTSVSAILQSVDGEQKRRDARDILVLMKEVTGKRPRMWGTSIVGLGSYHYKYQSGREGDWPVTGFSPRKQNPAVYNGRSARLAGLAFAAPVVPEATLVPREHGPRPDELESLVPYRREAREPRPKHTVARFDWQPPRPSSFVDGELVSKRNREPRRRNAVDRR